MGIHSIGNSPSESNKSYIIPVSEETYIVTSFVRLENISIGYTLPRQWTKRVDIERAKVYATVRNAAVWGSKDWEYYGDPETGNYASRIWTLGLNLTF